MEAMLGPEAALAGTSEETVAGPSDLAGAAEAAGAMRVVRAEELMAGTEAAQTTRMVELMASMAVD